MVDREWDFIYWDDDTDFNDDWTDSKPKKNNEGTTLED